jgi:UDP-N-acetylmuramyl pentapeptide phosphotransferase/UDP-N-acetylglucosamine-1-phosphate transferase
MNLMKKQSNGLYRFDGDHHHHHYYYKIVKSKQTKRNRFRIVTFGYSFAFVIFHSNRTKR